MKFNIHGLKIEFKSNDKDFREYISENFDLFSSNFKDADIKINFDYFAYNQKPRHLRPLGTIYLTSDLIISENSLYHKLRNLEILIIKRKNHYEINAVFNEDNISGLRKYRPHNYRKYVKNYQETKNENVHFSARYIFVLPIIYFLENQLDCAVLHGSCVEKDGRAIIFSGLNKVGKSTLSAFFHQKGYNNIADNFVLVKENKVYPFPERQRMDEYSMKLLNIKKSPEKTYFDKIHLKFSSHINQVKLEKIIILRFADKFNLRKLKPLEAFETLMCIADYLKEYPNYTYLTYLNLLDEKFRNTNTKRISNLQKIVKNKIFIMEYPKKTSLEQMYLKITYIKERK